MSTMIELIAKCKETRVLIGSITLEASSSKIIVTYHINYDEKYCEIYFLIT
jgi:hypothetical protein